MKSTKYLLIGGDLTSSQAAKQLRHLIRHKKDLTGKDAQLRDSTFAIKQLL